MYTIFFQSTCVLVYSVHVLALYVCTISIVLWYILCDGFTYILQAVGVTSALPNEVPKYLPYNYTASSKEWFFRDRTLLHNERQTDFPHLPYLHDLSAGDSVGLLVTTSGDLHIFFNGKSGHKIASGLPVNQSLWRVASVYGNCSKIKSEMLSGKLNAVSVCVFACVHQYVSKVSKNGPFHFVKLPFVAVFERHAILVTFLLRCISFRSISFHATSTDAAS